jgi:hypothetical protein
MKLSSSRKATVPFTDHKAGPLGSETHKPADTKREDIEEVAPSKKRKSLRDANKDDVFKEDNVDELLLAGLLDPSHDKHVADDDHIKGQGQKEGCRD